MADIYEDGPSYLTRQYASSYVSDAYSYQLSAGDIAEYRAMRASAWAEQNPERPDYENPHRNRCGNTLR